jgi:hypothetical protein
VRVVSLRLAVSRWLATLIRRFSFCSALESALSEEPSLDPAAAEHMRALGYVVATWATLEFEINKAIWELSNVAQHVGACVTAQIVPIVPRLRSYAALADLRKTPKAILAEINQFSTKADGLARRRARFVHDTWTVKEDTGEINRLHITADKKLEFGFKPVDLTEMTKLYNDISREFANFQELHKRVLASAPPFDRTQFERFPGIRPAPDESSS